MSLTLKNDRFSLRQQKGEQWVADEVVHYAHRLANLTNISVQLLWGQYDNGEPCGIEEPRWFIVYPHDEVAECVVAFQARKRAASGVGGTAGEVWDDDPIAVGYLSASGLTMLANGTKAIATPVRDELHRYPVYTAYMVEK